MTKPQKLSALSNAKPTLAQHRLASLSVALVSALLAVAAPARAQSLVDLYESARAFDANYQSAKLQYDANLAKANQAKAGILPAAGLYANAMHNEESTPYNSQTARFTAIQPLYRPVNLAAYEQGLKLVDLAKAQLDSAAQDLIVRTSQAYFDVLAALDTLAFVRAQKTAVAEQLASAKRNFEVGTSTITDTREAQARHDLVMAQEIAGENDLRIKKLTLDTLVGKTDAQPKGLIIPSALPPIVPADVNAWVDQSVGVHPSIRLAQNNYYIAELEVKKAEAGRKPTLDLKADYKIASNRSNVGTISLEFNLPLFTGFATQNRIVETIALKDKAQVDLEGARRTVALATRSAYFGVQSGRGQVKALEAAELSSQSALDANKLGYQVGVRINIDVLNAQSQLFQTKRDLAKARYDVLVGGLKLRQANGTLMPDDLLIINSLLTK